MKEIVLEEYEPLKTINIINLFEPLLQVNNVVVEMAKGNWKSTSLTLKIWLWLDCYRKSKRLRSIDEAIEHLILEAGYEPENNPASKEPLKVVA